MKHISMAWVGLCAGCFLLASCSRTDPRLSLYDAAEKSDARQVEALIKAGADVNEALSIPRRGHDRQTALHCAVNRGASLKVVEVLLEHGANVNAGTSYGTTPLMFCAGTCRNHRKMAQLLLRHGADVTARDSAGGTALHWAAIWANAEVETVSLLLEHHADVNVRDDAGQTPLHAWARSVGPFEPTGARVLIENGAEVNARDNQGKTPLDVATDNEKIAFLKTSGAATTK